MKALLGLVVLMAVAAPVFGGERYAVVITGASGDEAYAQKYDGWRATFVSTLREKFGYQSERVLVLAERESDGVLKATRENVQKTFADLRRRLTKDDQILVLLIGHGTTIDGAGSEDAKFNLVGPDLTATEWADLLKPLPGRLVFVNTTGASFPFLQKVAGRGRIVLTATDSAAQRFETVFPEFFVNAFEDQAADVDKNGRISVWEAFAYASAGVQHWFEQKGQLPTERPLLDDTGAGIGREAQNPGTDGAVAGTTYLEPDPASLLPGDSPVTVLMRRRADLEAELEQLKARKTTLDADQYEAELERLLVEIARISQQIRAKS